MKPPLELFPQDLKILTSVIVIFRVLTQLFLPIFSQDLSKIQNFVNKDYVSLQGFRGQSPTVKCCLIWFWYLCEETWLTFPLLFLPNFFLTWLKEDWRGESKVTRIPMFISFSDLLLYALIGIFSLSCNNCEI